MKEKNMTALVSCFARCYHYKNNEHKIFSDSISEKILTKEEYDSIANNMANGINFFNPNFSGSKDEALRWIVDNQLSPSVLGRSIFCENSLSNAIKIGCRQYLIYASGYDTFAYRNDISNIKVFEIDKAEMIEDKINRLDKSNLDYSMVNFIKCDFTSKKWINNIINGGYDKNQISFNSLLGISYYLSKEVFYEMIKRISNNICIGSSIIFDYPTYEHSKETQINEKLANGANERMKSKYLYREIERLLFENGLLIYEHLDHKEMTDSYFFKYNSFNYNNKIVAPRGVCYCLAVKKQ